MNIVPIMNHKLKDGKLSAVKGRELESPTMCSNSLNKFPLCQTCLRRWSSDEIL